MKLSIFNLILLSLLAFTACDKEILDKEIKDDPVELTGDDFPECVTYVFPISYTFPDGSIQSFDDEPTMNITIKNWFEANPDATEKPVKNFPIDIVLWDDAIQTVENEESIFAINLDCRYDYNDAPIDCFEFVYPINLNDPDGEVFVATSEGTLDAHVVYWSNDNPDSEAKPEVAYPVEVTLEDGTSQTIEDEVAMIALKESCEG